MIYPFEFRELLLTDGVLDALGFSPYWGGSGEYGERRFGSYYIIDHDEMDDPECGYGSSKPMYSSQHFSEGFKTDMNTLYFLHELYESIAKNSPEDLEAFVEKTKENGVNMYPYIESYLEYKKPCSKENLQKLIDKMNKNMGFEWATLKDK
jgi:hypothetical protein